jgi:hypothetical protein
LQITTGENKVENYNSNHTGSVNYLPVQRLPWLRQPAIKLRQLQSTQKNQNPVTSKPNGMTATSSEELSNAQQSIPR